MNVGELERELIKELKHHGEAYTVCTEKNGKSKRESNRPLGHQSKHVVTQEAYKSIRKTTVSY